MITRDIANREHLSLYVKMYKYDNPVPSYFTMIKKERRQYNGGV